MSIHFLTAFTRRKQSGFRGWRRKYKGSLPLAVIVPLWK